MFKESFKKYRNRATTLDLSEVIEFGKSEVLGAKRLMTTCNSDRDVEHFLGLKPAEEWKIYELSEREGLLFIPNPFTALGQRYWICRCLRDFPRKPHARLNLDAHGDLKDGEDWWEICTKFKHRKEAVLKKLRWATLGYHHNWDTKMYSDDAKDPFPADLAALCSYVAKVSSLGYFIAEAAIINFYHMDSTLSGHTDHSENNLEAPLFSFSFGQNAVFLLGGHTIQEKPSAMLVKSGDIIVMSGKSRLCYHGVPRILPGSSTPWNDMTSPLILEQNNVDQNVISDTLSRKRSHSPSLDNEMQGKLKVKKFDCNKTYIPSVSLEENYRFLSTKNSCLLEQFWEPFQEYVLSSRINMNVRQVLKQGQNELQGN